MTANAPTNDDNWTDSGNYATSFAGGSGTESDPYLISTPQQLALVAHYINDSRTTNNEYRACYYKQTSNLNLAQYWWEPIGSVSFSFSGYYDGSGYVIENMFINGNARCGLFGYISNSSIEYSVISNVNIENSQIIGGASSAYIGGIAGDISARTTISNCHCDIDIQINSTSGYIGGIVGSVRSNAEVSNCYFTGNIDIASGSANVGGIVGSNTGIISTCYNTGSINGGSTFASGLGGGSGIAGRNDSGGVVYNCYNLGEVSAGGGIIGYNLGSVYNCYIGGNCNVTTATGMGSGSIVNCGMCSDEQVQDLNWYLDPSNWHEDYPWDYDETWSIVDGVNDGLPILNSISIIITYHSNFNDETFVDGVVGSSTITILSNMFTRTGYNFTGWNTEANGSGVSYSAGASYSDLANLDLYAQWSRITYTITYNKNASDATGTMANTTKYYGTNVTLRTNAFTRTGYTFLGWATSANGDVVYSNGATYSNNASVTLYAKWDAYTYYVSFNGNGSTCGSMSSQTFRYGTAQNLTSNTYTKTGFTFAGWNRNADGTGTSYTNGQSVSNLTTSNGATITLYAQWTARNEAKHDSAGGYWYIENGAIPQTRVTNSSLISSINNSTTTGSNYYIAGLTLQARVYNGTEYCQWNGNWYEVELIKWRLDYSSSQTDGYGTTTDTNAVLAEIVYIGQYSTSSIDAGEGYSSSAVTEFMRNGISTTYLVNYATSTQTFGTGSTLYGTNSSMTARMFVSSQSEINAVNGTMNITFSNLVEDMIKYYGGTNVYFTRDLGSNYNNIVCFNEVGREVQRFATDYRGVQFTVRFTEYGCVN